MHDPQVKSAMRVLELFEHFSPTTQDATIMELARALGYPQSSTSALVSNLVRAGYLFRDQQTRRYRPTTRVAMLGAWVQPHLFRDGHLFGLVDEVSRATGDLVVVGMRIGAFVQYIHVKAGTNVIRVHVRNGETRPLGLSGMGKLFLSLCSPTEVETLAKLYNAHLEVREQTTIKRLISDLERIRACGYLVSHRAISAGVASIAMLLPTAEDPPLAIGIGAPISVVDHKRDEYVTLLRTSIDRFVALTSAQASKSAKKEAGMQKRIAVR